LNTPGGYISEGMEIFDIIRSYSKKKDIDIAMVNISVAASMGSMLMLASKVRIANKYSILMIHNPSTVAWGDADKMESEARALRIYETYSAEIYEEETGGKKDKNYFKNAMKKETWYSSEEMVDIGFATHIKNMGSERPYNPEKDVDLPKSVMLGVNNIASSSISMFHQKNVGFDDDNRLLSTLTNEQLTEKLWTRKSLKRWV
jgi:hypothetical protein